MAVLAGFWPEHSLHEASRGGCSLQAGTPGFKGGQHRQAGKVKAKFVGRGAKFGPGGTNVWCFGW